MVSSESDAAQPEAPSGSTIAPWDRAAVGWLLAVLVVAAVVLLVGIGGGVMRPFDEGLYGRLARNALEHGQYLYAVDHAGELYSGFSKPPLTIMAVAASFHALGVSLATLRLPFALSMLASMGVVFAWGRRIGGVPLGVAWAGTLLMSAATFRWGRVACIEPMLMLFVLTGLWAYHEAMLRRGRAMLGWALVAAVALCLAVATKQVVVGLALGPIVLLELWRGRWREAWPRVLLVVGLPAALGLAWLWAVIARVGDAAMEIYVRVGVIERVEGYRSGTGMRSLNELSDVVAEACQPFPWVLGAAGLVVLVMMRPAHPTGGRREVGGAMLLPLLLLTTVVVFENLSGSMRPWYAYNLVVPLTGGMGVLVAGLVDPAGDGLGIARAAGGALTLAVGAVAALTDLTSQLDAVVIVGVLLVVARRSSSDGRRWARARHLLLVAAGVAFAAGTSVRSEFGLRPAGHEQLMARLAARGITRIDVDTNTQLHGEHTWRTYYGPQAQWVTRVPWHTRDGADAYVTGKIWPSEFEPASGSEIIRVPGATALVGHLDQPSWSPSTLATLLEQGPLTFEAEHLSSAGFDVARADPDASGGEVIAVQLMRGRPRDPFLLAYGPGVRLPQGLYTAHFMLRYGCDGVIERPAAVLQVVAGRRAVRELQVSCPDREIAQYEPVELPFTLTKTSRVDLRVKYIYGELWFDRVVVTKRN